MFIAVINNSTLVTNEQADIMCKAIHKQLCLHVLPAWNLKNCTVRFYADSAKVPGYAWVISILDTIIQASALHHHSKNNDTVDAFVFAKPILDNNGVVLYDVLNPHNASISSVLSHEVCEMVGDRFANQWIDGPSHNMENHTYAMELCDPVDSDNYEIKIENTSVAVSNFIFPSWFNPKATVYVNLPFDYLKKLSAPFSITPGGYMIVRQNNKINHIFGEKVHSQKQVHVKCDWYRR